MLNEKPRSRRSVIAIVSLLAGIIVGFCFSRMADFETVPNFDRTFATITLNLSNVAEEYDTQEANPDSYALENTDVAQILFNEVRVLCWILTAPEFHKTRAMAVKNTWGKRCNKLIFISSAEDNELDTVVANVSEGHDFVWGKTKRAFKYIYAHHFDDADWFLKADDDTYVILENLRYMLYAYSPDTPIHFGFKYKTSMVKQGYMSGGAGYVLSKEALSRFVTKALPERRLCRSDDRGAEDVEIGKCLQNVQVLAGDSRDTEGRGRFFPFVPEDHINAKIDMNYWYWKNMFYKVEVGLNCCSDRTISFHYITPNAMNTLEYLIYHLRPYGIAHNAEPLPKILTFEEVLKALNVTATKHELIM